LDRASSIANLAIPGAFGAASFALFPIPQLSVEYVSILDLVGQETFAIAPIECFEWLNGCVQRARQ
jgi:hypothetical protein